MRILVALLLTISFCIPASAGIYHYVNEDGRRVYVDNIGRVPHRYRDQLDVLKETSRPVKRDEVQVMQDRILRANRSTLKRNRRRVETEIKRLEMPINIVNNRIIAPVKMVYGSRSVNLDLVMDTGASSTVVHRNAVDSLGGQYEKAGVARVADGRTVPTDRIKLDSVVIGPYEVPRASSLVIDNQNSGGTSGLLGMDFLLNAKYEIDIERQMVIWEPKLYGELRTLMGEIEGQLQKLETAQIQ